MSPPNESLPDACWTERGFMHIPPVGEAGHRSLRSQTARVLRNASRLQPSETLESKRIGLKEVKNADRHSNSLFDFARSDPVICAVEGVLQRPAIPLYVNIAASYDGRSVSVRLWQSQSLFTKHFSDEPALTVLICMMPPQCDLLVDIAPPRNLLPHRRRGSRLFPYALKTDRVAVETVLVRDRAVLLIRDDALWGNIRRPAGLPFTLLMIAYRGSAFRLSGACAR